MDILQIRKKRMAELAHPVEASREPLADGPSPRSATTRALLGLEHGAAVPQHVSRADGRSVDEAVHALRSDDERTREHRRASAADRHDEAARQHERAPPVAGDSESVDPLDGFLALYDVVDADSVTPFAAAVSVVEAPRLLTFDLGAESFAANIADIREIIKMGHVTPVPRAPAGVLGVISKRGVVMPVVDLAAALRLRPVRRELLPDQRVLVTGEGEDVVGLRVDRVHGVTQIATSELLPVPSGVSTTSVAFFRGLTRRAEGMFIVIDLAVFREHLTTAAHDGAIA